ncbi:MAG TPA: Asp-tRNA(Asn)/Glu-tRNA(Gln) amidotransferase subunit GatA [Thermoanaerobaculia bacterium]|nr:Asp-tRNA(Asn)/Glu-tRNA(Gln) amidotransferase subunit GatA [Thermoanaerobaculia bacterium]
MGNEPNELWELPAEEVARQVRAGERSAVAVTEAALARTARVEPLLAAYLALYPDAARARAAEIDARVAAGEDPGPLAGVPVALKDNLNVQGFPVTCGSKILQGYVAPYTATAVARLLAAGAVILGRANMDEFAMGSSCENSAFQKTRNPWDLRAVPGGSSGGPAAAVAAGSVALALGSDTGGSIRQPAALCGVVGVKPTWSRVSRYGLVAFASSTDQIGPLARTVRDAALTLRVLAGADPNDATSSLLPVDDYLEGIEAGIAGLKIGVIQEIDDSGLPEAARRSFRESLDRLVAAGAEIVPVSVPTVDAAVAVYYVIATSEASANLARFDGVRYGRRSQEAESLADLYLDSRSEGFGPEVKRRIMLGTFALSSGYYDAYYGRAKAVLDRMRRELERALGDVDVIATPTTPGAAFRLGEKADDPLAMYLSDVYTTPASLTGLPAIAVPSGADDAGLPLSLQLTARAFDEATMFRVARAFEREVGWQVAPRFVGAMGATGAEASP